MSATIAVFLQEFTKDLIDNSISQKEKDKLIEEFVQNQRKAFVEMPKQSLSYVEPIQEKQIAVQKEEVSRQFVFDTRPISSIEQPQNNQNNQDYFEANQEGQSDLNKIDKFVKDNSIVSIDCSGPGRFIVLRNITGRQVITKIVLMKEDIDSILNYFSNAVRIPRIGGIFKAIVGNLVITAIDSDVAGPRFIITKIVQRKSNFI
ncbi:MAG: hypothetical protein WC796_03470 [Candidatus Pacearchaeota archaeon]|jgi:hypothetical protein